METHAAQFLQTATPSLREVSERLDASYGYVRQAATGAADPSPALRRKLALWGWDHVRALIQHLFVLDADVAQELVATILREHSTSERPVEAQGEASPRENPSP